MPSMKTQIENQVPVVETTDARAAGRTCGGTDVRYRRRCGECSACCTAMGVRSIGKKAWSTCVHSTGKGCDIYRDRPAACASFTCVWLADRQRLLRESDRPDTLGLLLTDVMNDDGTPGIAARELYPAAAQRPRAQHVLAFFRQFLKVTVIPAKGNCTAITIGGCEIETPQPGLAAA